MYYGFRPYVSVGERRRKAKEYTKKLVKKGRKISPVELATKKIATSFWGKSWCENLESYSDFENRLPRGRTYVRNGSVIDLQITPGKVQAMVSGSEIYEIEIEFKPLAKERWKAIKRQCSGQIASVVELLQGKFSDAVMRILTDRDTGLFPAPDEIKLDCSCPDWADMCKHVAAVLYGVGSRLDHEPQLFFTLRQVDQAELIEAAGRQILATPAGDAATAISDENLADVFGIDVESDIPVPPAAPASTSPSARATAITPASAGRPAKARKPKASESAKSAQPAKPATAKSAPPPKIRATKIVNSKPATSVAAAASARSAKPIPTQPPKPRQTVRQAKPA